MEINNLTKKIKRKSWGNEIFIGCFEKAQILRNLIVHRMVGLCASLGKT